MPRLQETLKFPKYKHQPYPKMVTAPDGTRVKVLDERQELEVASRAAKPPEKPSAEAEAAQELVQKAHEAQNRAADAEAKLGQTLDQLMAQEAQMKKMQAQMMDLQAKLSAVTKTTSPALKPGDPPKPSEKAA